MLKIIYNTGYPPLVVVFLANEIMSIPNPLFQSVSAV